MGNTDFMSSFFLENIDHAETKAEAVMVVLDEFLTNYKAEWDRGYPELGKGIIESEDELIEVWIKMKRKLDKMIKMNEITLQELQTTRRVISKILREWNPYYMNDMNRCEDTVLELIDKKITDLTQKETDDKDE